MSRPVTIARPIKWAQVGQDFVGTYPPTEFRIAPPAQNDGNGVGWALQSGSYHLGYYPTPEHARAAAQDYADTAVLNSMTLVCVHSLADRLSVMATIAPEPYTRTARLVLDYLAGHGDADH